MPAATPKLRPINPEAKRMFLARMLFQALSDFPSFLCYCIVQSDMVDFSDLGLTVDDWGGWRLCVEIRQWLRGGRGVIGECVGVRKLGELSRRHRHG